MSAKGRSYQLKKRCVGEMADDHGSEQIDTPTVYANVANVEIGNFDVTLRFGRKKNKGEPLSGRDFDVEVIMSPQHAKSFLEVLQNHIQQYEAIFGEQRFKVRDEDLEGLREKGVHIQRMDASKK